MMQASRKIKPPHWMTGPGTKAVMQALGGDAAPPQALFVGGCVRNEIMEININQRAGDIDIATSHAPAESMTRLEKAGIKVLPTGIDHGTVTAVTPERSFEITTLRRDVETDGRHAVVAYTDDWAEDAARRDFTMNTLLADAQGNIYDPTGEGLRDLAARKVVFVGEPSRRIAEDYLRILRFFRFHAYYGGGNPDPAALRACRDASDKIVTLSRERITQEFLKIVAVDHAAAILDLMFDHNVLADLPHRGYSPAVMQSLATLQKENDMPDIAARLAVLSDLKGLEKYLVLSNAQKKTIEQVNAAHAVIGKADDVAIKKLIYAYGGEIAGQAVLLHAAIGNTQANAALVKTWQPPVFPLNGEDVIAAGIPPGPDLGRVLKKVEEWWIDQDFKPDRHACLEKIRKF